MEMLQLDIDSLVQTNKAGEDAGYKTATGGPRDTFSHLQPPPAFACGA